MQTESCIIFKVLNIIHYYSFCFLIGFKFKQMWPTSTSKVFVDPFSQP